MLKTRTKFGPSQCELSPNKTSTLISRSVLTPEGKNVAGMQHEVSTPGGKNRAFHNVVPLGVTEVERKRLRVTPIRQEMGVSRCRPQPGRHRRHTHPVCRLISHISSRQPVTLSVPAIPASQRTVQLGGKTEDGAAGSYSNPYTRDETGPVVPPCLENSTLTYISQRPAHANVSIGSCQLQ